MRRMSYVSGTETRFAPDGAKAHVSDDELSRRWGTRSWDGESFSFPSCLLTQVVEFAGAGALDFDFIALCLRIMRHCRRSFQPCMATAPNMLPENL